METSKRDHFVHVVPGHDVYLVNTQARTITKFPRKTTEGSTTYSGYPDACTCPSFDHRRACKHLALWAQWHDGVDFVARDAVAHEKAMAAFGVLAQRTNWEVKFHSFDIGPQGIRGVLATATFPEFDNQSVAGVVDGVLIRVFGRGRAPVTNP